MSNATGAHSDLKDRQRAKDQVVFPVETYDDSPRSGAVRLVLKRVFDILISALLLILLIPLFSVIAIAIKLTSRGPVFYVQDRCGKGGTIFKFIKFRTMQVDAQKRLSDLLESDSNAAKAWAKFQKLDNDPRIIPVGRPLRKSSLDELPQLINVLCGDMSLVGPRPCMPEQRVLYGGAWRSYISVRPGLTGLWQVSGRNRLTYAERIRLDSEYVATWSLGLDLKILVRTIKVVITGDGSQ